MYQHELIKLAKKNAKLSQKRMEAAKIEDQKILNHFSVQPGAVTFKINGGLIVPRSGWQHLIQVRGAFKTLEQMDAQGNVISKHHYHSV